MSYLNSTYKKIESAVVGGDIVSILLRQGVRLRGLQLGNAQIGWPKYTSPSVFLAGIPITTKQQEAYTYQSDVSQFAIEDARMVSDHVILKPLRISIVAEVSNWEPGAAQYALTSLEALWRSRELVDLMTFHKKIPNMVLANFEAVNDVPNWGSLAFRATFQNMPLSTIETTDYPEEKVKPTAKTSGPDNSKSAASSTDNGKQKPADSRLKAVTEYFTKG